MKRSVLLLSIATISLMSIVTRHDVLQSRYFEIGEQYNQIINMYDVGHGTGTLVADQWILTAAHVNAILTVGRTIKIKGASYVIEKIIDHPGFAVNNGIPQNDIGLVKVDRSVSEVDVIPLYRCTNEVGKVVIFVGQGAEGTGESGVANFQTRDRKLRGATNIVTKATSQFITFSFDPPGSPNSTQYEGISGAGDSGGPAFIESENGLSIAGVSSFQNSNGQPIPGTYGVEEYYTRVSFFVEWIEDTISTN